MFHTPPHKNVAAPAGQFVECAKVAPVRASYRAPHGRSDKEFVAAANRMTASPLPYFSALGALYLAAVGEHRKIIRENLANGFEPFFGEAQE